MAKGSSDNETNSIGPQKYVIEGFSGGLHSEGIISKIQIADTECTCASNIDFYPPGTVSKRGGRTYKNTSTQLSGAITQIYQFYNPAGAPYLMIFTAASGTTASADVYSFTPSANISTQYGTFASIFGAAQATGAGEWNPSTDETIFVESFAGSAIFIDGVHYVYAWDATTCSAITTAPKAAKFIKGYKNYLFLANTEEVGGGTRYGSRVWWSNPTDAHTWPGSNYIDLDPNDGDEITGMEILSNELIIYKGGKIYAITYIGGIYEFFSEVRVDGRGCAAGSSLGGSYGDITFYEGTGFYSFDGRNVIELSEKIRDIILNINPTNSDKIFTASYDEKNQLFMLVPMASSETNNSLLIYDYSQKSWTIHTLDAASLGWYTLETDLTFGDLPDGYGTYDITWGDKLLLGNTALILAGTYDGYMLDIDTSGVNADIGEDYEGYWRSKWIDFGIPDYNKRITRITFYLDREATVIADDYSMYINIYKDWDNSEVANSQTLSLYGTDPVLERRLDFTMQCRALQLQFGTTMKDRPFTVHRIVIDYYIKGRTLVS